MSKEAELLGEEAKGNTLCPQTNVLKKGLKHSREVLMMDGF